MKAYWDPIDDEYMNYEAEVTTCVLSGDNINICFNGRFERVPFDGKISLKAVNSDQTAIGSWGNITLRKLKDSTKEDVLKATVTGRLNNFRGRKVTFQGRWEDQSFAYDFEIDAEITNNG